MITFNDYKFIYHKVGGLDVKFEPSDEDRTSSDYHYYGYLHSSGSWIIQRFDFTVTNVVTTRYAAGQSGYATAYAGKALLDYYLLNEIVPL